MLHTKFRGNRPVGSREEDFKGFLPYMGMASILVMRPASCHQIFISLYLKAFIKNLVRIGKVVSEKICFNFACRFWRRFLKGFYHIWAWRPSWSCDPDVHDLGPRP